MNGDEPMKDARRAERVQVSLPARLMIDGQELQAEVIDASVTGLALTCDTRPRMGADAILYVDGLSRFEARVARYFKGGFAVTYALPEAKRARVTAKLMSLVSGETRPGQRDRAEAGGGGGRRALVTLEDGTPIDAAVLDASVIGVTLRTRARPALGTRLIVRGAPAKVTRYTADGLMVEFDRYWEGVSRLGSCTPASAARR